MGDSSGYYRQIGVKAARRSTRFPGLGQISNGEVFKAAVMIVLFTFSSALLLFMLRNSAPTVDGTLLEAWASLKSFQAKDKESSSPPDDPGNPTVNFHGEKRSNQTHESKTDPDAHLARKGLGKEAKLSYSGNLLVENCNGLIVSSTVWEATGTAERLSALAMLEQIPGTGRVTVGGDKGFDTAEFVRECRNISVTPHVAQNLGRRGGSAIDSRTTQHAGYRISQKKRKRIEECFGWLKTIALLRKVRHRGTLKVDWIFTFACAAYNLVRMRNLMAAAVPAQ